MSDARLTRRLVSAVRIRLYEAAFDQVRDDRATRGRRWSLRTLLVAVTTAMVAGARSLADANAVRSHRLHYVFGPKARSQLCITPPNSGSVRSPPSRPRPQPKTASPRIPSCVASLSRPLSMRPKVGTGNAQPHAAGTEGGSRSRLPHSEHHGRAGDAGEPSGGLNLNRVGEV